MRGEGPWALWGDESPVGTLRGILKVVLGWRTSKGPREGG